MFEDIIKTAFEDSIHTKNLVVGDIHQIRAIERIAEELVALYRNRGKLLIAGNGGSAADAQHFAAEITCQFMVKRKARPALALHSDTSALTAWGNDHSFETAFARQVEAHGIAGDALFVISTSGNSRNLIRAAQAARDKGMRVFGLLGKNGGKLSELGLCHEHIVVPSFETPRIQECHILIIHVLCEILDRGFALEDTQG